MTILEPNKSTTRVNKFFVCSVSALIAVALWSIFVYNQTVNVAHSITSYEKEYKLLLAKNAELKNRIYAVTDVKALRQFAAGRGLVPVKSPEYVESAVSALAANTTN